MALLDIAGFERPPGRVADVEDHYAALGEPIIDAKWVAWRKRDSDVQLIRALAAA